jgi:hypothetical protein
MYTIPMVQCGCMTVQKRQCLRPAVTGSTFCQQHLFCAPPAGPPLRCQCLKVNDVQCSRPTATGLTLCWQHYFCAQRANGAPQNLRIPFGTQTSARERSAGTSPLRVVGAPFGTQTLARGRSSRTSPLRVVGTPFGTQMLARVGTPFGTQTSARRISAGTSPLRVVGTPFGTQTLARVGTPFGTQTSARRISAGTSPLRVVGTPFGTQTSAGTQTNSPSVRATNAETQANSHSSSRSSSSLSWGARAAYDAANRARKAATAAALRAREVELLAELGSPPGSAESIAQDAAGISARNSGIADDLAARARASATTAAQRAHANRAAAHAKEAANRAATASQNARDRGNAAAKRAVANAEASFKHTIASAQEAERAGVSSHITEAAVEAAAEERGPAPLRRSTRATSDPDWLHGVQNGRIGKKKSTKRGKGVRSHVEAAAEAITAAANTRDANAAAALEVAQVNLAQAAEEAAKEGVELNPHVEAAQETVEAAINAPNEAVAANAIETAEVHINEAAAKPLRRSSRVGERPDYRNTKPRATRKSKDALAHVEAAAQAITAAATTGGAGATANLEVAQDHLTQATEKADGEGVELNPHVEVAQHAVEAAIRAPNVAAAVHATEVANAHINEALRRSSRIRKQANYSNGRQSQSSAAKKSKGALAHLEAAAQAVNVANTRGVDAAAALEVAHVNLVQAAEEAAREGVELNPHVKAAQEAVEAAINAPNEAVAANAIKTAEVHINEAAAKPLRRSSRVGERPDYRNTKPRATRKSKDALAHVEAAAQAITTAADTGGARATANLEFAQDHLTQATEKADREGVKLNPHVEVAQHAVEAAIRAPNVAAAVHATEVANAHINEALRRSSRIRKQANYSNGRQFQSSAAKKSKGALAHVEAAAQAVNVASNTRGVDATVALEVAHGHLHQASGWLLGGLNRIRRWGARVEVPHVELAAQAVEVALNALNQAVADNAIEAANTHVLAAINGPNAGTVNREIEGSTVKRFPSKAGEFYKMIGRNQKWHHFKSKRSIVRGKVVEGKYSWYPIPQRLYHSPNRS